MKTLIKLIEEVDNMFPANIGEINKAFSFVLARYDGGAWNFHVVDSWHNWNDKNYKHQFIELSPEEAIISFLNYVKENKIDVKSLMERGPPKELQ